MRSVAFAVLGFSILLTGCQAPQQSQVGLNGAPAEAHYAPSENLERIDVALLQQAKRSVDVAAYSLTDLVVANALMDAAHRGVHVRIYRDQTQTRGEDARAAKVSRGRKKRSGDDNDDDNTSDANDLGARLSSTPNVEVRVKHSHTLMHLKSYCVDGALVRSGSANFSPTGEKRQDNDLIIMRDAATISRFQANFDDLWRRADNERVTP